MFQENYEFTSNAETYDRLVASSMTLDLNFGLWKEGKVLAFIVHPISPGRRVG